MKTKVANGFTLLEAMAVIAMLAILAAMAYPSFQNTIAHNRTNTAQMGISKALSYARSEAMSRNKDMILCPTENKDSIELSCGSADDWSNGFFVFVDKDRDGSYDKSSDGDPLQIYSLKPPVHISVTDKNSTNKITGYVWVAGGLRLKTKPGSTGLVDTTITITPSEDGTENTNMSRTCTIERNGHVNCS